MCGIAGIISNHQVNPEILVRMNRRMSHRGPDGEGFVALDQTSAIPLSGDDTRENCKNNRFAFSAQKHIQHTELNSKVFLAHRRLAIIDIDAGGHQPMCDISENIWITYNGEIYNYIELRKELETLGHSFQTQSDTEVILASWKQWGEACQHKFNGMWAFLLIDQTQGIAFASRDRFGVKPFYYVSTPEAFVFASEQKVLLESGLIRAELNREAAFDYFMYGEIEFKQESFFKGILELHGGHSLQFRLDHPYPQTKQWYTLATGNEHQKAKSSDVIEKIEHLLSEAVRIRLRADVPVGSCLSGGLDSSAIVGFMRKHLGQAELPVFTATFPGTNVDEGKWAKQAADFNHAHQFEVTPTAEELIRDLGELMFAQDIPIWSTSTYAQFRVMKLVKEQGIRVVLDGQGGDEIFGGYDPHRYFYLKGQTPISGINHVVKGNLSFFLRQYLRFDGVPSLPTSIQHKINLSYFKDLSFIQPDFITEQFRHIDLRQNPESHGLNERLSWEMQNHTLKSYLKCEDRCAMWHSVESRTPFADDFPLIEYVFGLPADLKFDGARLKTLLREASSSVMPEAIKNRSDKQGYTTPNRAWLSKIAPEMSEVFSDALGDIFQVEKIRAEYSNLLTNKALNDDGRLFKYLSFAIWHREFVR